jgi:hypothetical protein
MFVIEYYILFFLKYYILKYNLFKTTFTFQTDELIRDVSKKKALTTYYVDIVLAL